MCDTNKRQDIISGQWCPYCDQPTVLIDSAEIYNGRSYGWAWTCRTCFAYVGCHKGTTNALGRVADQRLRSIKRSTHAIFDPLWKKLMKISNYSKVEARTAMYMWLSLYTRIPLEECHIGMFDEEQCQETLHIINKFNPFKNGPDN